MSNLINRKKIENFMSRVKNKIPEEFCFYPVFAEADLVKIVFSEKEIKLEFTDLSTEEEYIIDLKGKNCKYIYIILPHRIEVRDEKGDILPKATEGEELTSKDNPDRHFRVKCYYIEDFYPEELYICHARSDWTVEEFEEFVNAKIQQK